MKFPLKRTHIFIIGILCIGISFVHLFTNSLDESRNEPSLAKSGGNPVVRTKVSLDYETGNDVMMNDHGVLKNKMATNLNSNGNGNAPLNANINEMGDMDYSSRELPGGASRADDTDENVDSLDIEEGEDSEDYSDEDEESEDEGRSKNHRETKHKTEKKRQVYVRNRINGFLREISNCNSTYYTKIEIQSNILCATPETVMSYPAVEKYALNNVNSPCFFVRQSPRNFGDHGWLFDMAKGNFNLMDGSKTLNLYKLNCLPALFLVGFPKCGTTELHQRLTSHHNVHGALRKEVSWFANGKWNENFYDEQGNSTLNLYAFMRMFGKGAQTIENDILTRQTEIWQDQLDESDSAPPGRARRHYNPGKQLSDNKLLSRAVLMDSSPSNFDAEYLEKIAHLLPNAKLIFSMRDPVEREFSKYRFHFQTSKRKLFSAKNQNADAFHEYVTHQLNKTEPFRTSTSYYHQYVETALTHFKRENLMFIQFEELIEDPMRLIEQQVLPFLNLDPYELQTRRSIVREISKGDHANQSRKSYHMHYKTKVLLMKHFRPFNRKLAYALEDEKWTWGY